MGAQGVLIYGRFPKTKKEVKAAVLANPASVSLTDTSPIFGGQYVGRISDAPDGVYTIVLPNPQDRKTFGNIVVKNGKFTVK